MDSAGRSKMTGLGGGLPPRIVPAAGVSHWRCNELVGGHIVDAELDRYKVAADLLDVAAAEWAHAAMLAEQVMAALGRELSSTPEISRNASGLMMTPQFRVLVQIEQLHFPVPAARSMSAS